MAKIINPLKLKESDKLEAAWRKELNANGVSDKSRKLQQDWIDFNKKNFPVILSHITGVDYLSKKPYDYGSINFSEISGWADTEPFFDVIKGKYEPNEFSKSIGLNFSRNGGSAFYDFKWTDENIKKLEDKLKSYNYKVYIDLDNKFKSGGKTTMAKKITNQYAGKTEKEIWAMWDESQKRHFLSDHFTLTDAEIDDYASSEFHRLPADVQIGIDIHKIEGQYAKGGKTPQKGSAEWNQLQIAKRTIKLTPSGATLMGGMTIEEAKNILDKYGIEYAKGGLTPSKAFSRAKKLYKKLTEEQKKAVRVLSRQGGIKDSKPVNYIKKICMQCTGDDAEVMEKLQGEIKTFEKGGAMPESKVGMLLIISDENPLSKQLIEYTGDHYNLVDFDEEKEGDYSILTHKKTGKIFINIPARLVVDKSGDLIQNEHAYLKKKYGLSKLTTPSLKNIKGFEFAKGGTTTSAELVDFESANAGNVKAYKSISDNNLYYYVEQDGISFMVISEVEGFPEGASEAFDDWFGNYEDAMEIAKMLAEDQDPNDEFAKGGKTKMFPKSPAKLAEHLMQIVSDMEDEIGVQSGSQLYSDKELQLKYKNYLDEKLSGLQYPLNYKVHDELEDANYHSFNQYLTLSGGYGEAEKQKWIDFINKREPKDRAYFLDITPYLTKPTTNNHQLTTFLKGLNLQTLPQQAKDKVAAMLHNPNIDLITMDSPIAIAFKAKLEADYPAVFNKPWTEQDIRDALAGQLLLAEMGDETAQANIISYQILLDDMNKPQKTNNSPADIWDNFTEDQRKQFLYEHNFDGDFELWTDMNYAKLMAYLKPYGNNYDDKLTQALSNKFEQGGQITTHVQFKSALLETIGGNNYLRVNGESWQLTDAELKEVLDEMASKDIDNPLSAAEYLVKLDKSKYKAVSVDEGDYVTIKDKDGTYYIVGIHKGNATVKKVGGGNMAYNANVDDLTVVQKAAGKFSNGGITPSRDTKVQVYGYKDPMDPRDKPIYIGKKGFIFKTVTHIDDAYSFTSEEEMDRAITEVNKKTKDKNGDPISWAKQHCEYEGIKKPLDTSVTSKDLPKDGSPIKVHAPEVTGFPAIDIILKYDAKNFIFDIYDGKKKVSTITEQKALENFANGFYVLVDKKADGGPSNKFSELSPRKKLDLLGVDHTDDFGDKYRKWINKIVSANNLGDYVGYQLSMADNTILVIGKKGTVTAEFDSYDPVKFKLLSTKMVHYKQGGSTSTFSTDTDKWFDAVVDNSSDLDEKAKEIITFTTKEATKSNLETIGVKISKSISFSAVAKHALQAQIKKIKTGKYKKEFKYQYGGKKGSGGKTSATSEFFSMLHQALTYNIS